MSRFKAERAYRIKGDATKAKRKMTGGSAGTPEGHKTMRLVAYCPHCPTVSNRPESSVHVTLQNNEKGKRKRCEKGHEFNTA